MPDLPRRTKAQHDSSVRMSKFKADIWRMAESYPELTNREILTTLVDASHTMTWQMLDAEREGRE